MAELIVVYWRDIPAQVIARAGRRNQVKIELDERFAKAIDIAAMKGGARDDDAYLADWRKADPVGVSDDLAGEAAAPAALAPSRDATRVITSYSIHYTKLYE